MQLAKTHPESKKSPQSDKQIKEKSQKEQENYYVRLRRQIKEQQEKEIQEILRKRKERDQKLLRQIEEEEKQNKIDNSSEETSRSKTEENTEKKQPGPNFLFSPEQLQKRKKMYKTQAYKQAERKAQLKKIYAKKQVPNKNQKEEKKQQPAQKENQKENTRDENLDKENKQDRNVDKKENQKEDQKDEKKDSKQDTKQSDKQNEKNSQSESDNKQKEQKQNKDSPKKKKKDKIIKKQKQKPFKRPQKIPQTFEQAILEQINTAQKKDKWFYLQDASQESQQYQLQSSQDYEEMEQDAWLESQSDDSLDDSDNSDDQEIWEDIYPPNYHHISIAPGQFQLAPIREKEEKELSTQQYTKELKQNRQKLQEEEKKLKNFQIENGAIFPPPRELVFKRQYLLDNILSLLNSNYLKYLDEKGGMEKKKESEQEQKKQVERKSVKFNEEIEGKSFKNEEAPLELLQKDTFKENINHNQKVSQNKAQINPAWFFETAPKMEHQPNIKSIKKSKKTAIVQELDPLISKKDTKSQQSFNGSIHDKFNISRENGDMNSFQKRSSQQKQKQINNIEEGEKNKPIFVKKERFSPVAYNSKQKTGFPFVMNLKQQAEFPFPKKQVKYLSVQKYLKQKMEFPSTFNFIKQKVEEEKSQKQVQKKQQAEKPPLLPPEEEEKQQKKDIHHEEQQQELISDERIAQRKAALLSLKKQVQNQSLLQNTQQIVLVQTRELPPQPYPNSIPRCQVILNTVLSFRPPKFHK